MTTPGPPEAGALRTVGVRDFRDHATDYLGSARPLAITRHGRVIGFYVPVPSSLAEETRVALRRLADTVARIQAQTGISEDELGDLLDLRNEPPP